MPRIPFLYPHWQSIQILIQSNYFLKQLLFNDTNCLSDMFIFSIDIQFHLISRHWMCQTQLCLNQILLLKILIPQELHKMCANPPKYLVSSLIHLALHLQIFQQSLSKILISNGQSKSKNINSIITCSSSPLQASSKIRNLPILMWRYHRELLRHCLRRFQQFGREQRPIVL